MDGLVKRRQLVAACLLASACGGSPAAPTGAPPEPSQAVAREPRRLRAITVSGPAVPGVLALPAAAALASGLAARYFGRSGGNLSFEVDPTLLSAGVVALAGADVEVKDGHVCALTWKTTAGDEITSSRSVFLSEAEMNGDDPTWNCDWIQCLSLHEAGHGLGLHHCTEPCTDNIMSTNSTRQTCTWGPGDLAALAALYR
jgi:hypothetical protein